MIVALSLPMLMGMAGLAVDMGIWYRETARLQIAADAGAVGAAFLLPNAAAATGDFQNAALVEAQGITGGGTNTLIGTLNTPVAVAVATDRSHVQVTLTSTADSYFTRVLGIAPPILQATAIAGVNTPPPTMNACILALATSAPEAIWLHDNGSIAASGCSVFANSSAKSATATANAMYLNSGQISAESIGSVGGIGESNSGSNKLTPAGTTGLAAVADPYAQQTAPTPAGCNYSPGSYSACCTYNGASFTGYRSTPYEFAGGTVFCGNTTIGGNDSQDQFAPGIYYIINGNLTFNNAMVTQANGVSFVFIGATPGAFIWTNYSGNYDLAAPTSGPTAGILVWQACPANGSLTTQTDSFQGGSTLVLSGAFYAPCAAFNAGNNAQIETASNSTMSIIAQTFQIYGSAGLHPVGNGSGVSAGGGGPTQVVLLQ